MRTCRAPLRMRPWQGRPVGPALPVAAADVFGLLHYAAATPLTASLACTPSPRLRARLVRFAPAVRPAPGVLRVLRRRTPLVGLAPRRRSRVPTQVTSEDGLGAPFVPLRRLTAAQPPRSASGQDTKTVLAAGPGKEYLPDLGGGTGVVSAVSGPCR
jgi:hypothetical protein